MKQAVKKHFLLPFLVLSSLVLLAINIVDLRAHPLNPGTVIYLSAAFSFFAFFLWFRVLDNESPAKRVLVAISVPIFLVSIFFVFFLEVTPFSFSRSFFIFIAILSWLVISINNTGQGQDDAEEKEPDNFSTKFPRINQVPVLRILVRWGYIEGWKYSIGLIAIIVLGLFVRTWGLSNLGFWFDEGLSVLIAKSFLTDSHFVFPGGTFYERALPYHAYIGSLYLFFKDLISDNSLLRIVNLPFYVLNSFLIYSISKKFLPKQFALLTVFLFSFSWVSISMFREVRFYEFSLTTYLLLSLVFLKYFKMFSVRNLANMKIVVWLVSLITIFYIGFLIHPSIVIFLYVLSVFYFLIALKDRSGEYFAISLISFSIILGGMFFLVKKTFPFIHDFSMGYLFKLPLPEWASLAQSGSLANVSEYLISNGHLFILLILITLPASILIARKKEQIFVLVSMVVTYLFLAYQGYDHNSIRYYYVVIPFLIMAFTATIFDFFKVKKIFAIFPILLLVPYFQAGYSEILSTQNFNSRNVMKSFDYQEAFSFLENNKPCKVLTDIQISVPYYVYSSKKPDLIIYDSSTLALDTTADPYLGVQYSDYTSLPAAHSCKTYFVFIYMKTQISENSWRLLNQRGSEIYQDKALLIYEIF